MWETAVHNGFLSRLRPRINHVDTAMLEVLYNTLGLIRLPKMPQRLPLANA